ncbi:MAG: tRNA modification GTPase TrmE [Pseudomonadota bacterium]|jgi:tRNA modification GTPase|nr:tRNA uridine-5-carboxymethylaminomethyl(34) synthesis GTPase MnmE [Oxalobacteraceae bacterium]
MLSDASPIAAIATAPGRGGIGVVRLSGKGLMLVARAVCRLSDGQSLQPRHATYLDFINADGGVIDSGLAIWFPGPHSYTGEDVLELQGHGGPVVMQMLLNRCIEAGQSINLRLADPGEFTYRAFQNDKMDLAQAEAVSDLIEASTEAAAKLASQSLSGAFSQIIHQLVQQLIQLRTLVEATLDFPEEEIEFLEKSDARGKLHVLRETLDNVIAQAAQGALLRDGLKVVLAGQPNVGKSSLLNALAGSDIAIVTPIAGTTRDKITETIQVEGIPINIIDTAGIRNDAEADGEVERIGISRTWAAVEQADVVLHILDASRGPTRADEEILSRLPMHVPLLRVWNKIDLSGHKPSIDVETDVTHIYLSASEKLGMDLLRKELLRIAGWQQTGESIYLARERHLLALKAAQANLQTAADLANQRDSALDLFAEELRLAQERLGSITGAFTSDDLLGVIFSRFCIGK